MNITAKSKTIREEVLWQREVGMTYREISILLGIGYSTVRYHADPKMRANVIRCTTLYNKEHPDKMREASRLFQKKKRERYKTVDDEVRKDTR